MQKELKELSIKASLSLMGQIIGQILSCILVVLISRCLGAAVYGEYLYVYTFVSFFTILAKLGMENAIVYYISRNNIEHDEKEKIVQFILEAAATVGITLVCIMYFAKDWIAETLLNNINYSQILLLLLPLIVLEAISALFFSILKGKKWIFELTVAKNIIGTGVSIIFLFIMYYLLQIRNVFSIIIPQYVGGILAILYCIYQINKKEKRTALIHVHLDLDKCKEVMRYSLPLVLMNVVVLINHNADKYMIGYLMDSSNVAIYTVAIYISQFSSFALTAVNNIFAPLISELYASDKIEELDMLYKKATRWVMIINLAIFSMAINFPYEIMRLAGNDFETGGIVLIIVMLGQIVNSGVGAVGSLNSMTGHTKINLFTSVIAVIINLGLNFLFIKPYGMIGAAVASAISLALTNLINLWFVYKNVKVFPYTKRYIGVGLAFFLATLFVHVYADLVSYHFFIKLLIGGVLFVFLYFTFVYLWGLDSEEKEIIKKIRGRRV